MLEPANTVSILQKQAEPKTFSADQVIFKEADPANYMYGILEGEVNISVNGKIVETIGKGEVFGTGTLIGVGDRTYSAIAKTDCTLAFLDQQRFLFAVQETPMFALDVMKSYSERLNRLVHNIMSA
ncbi:MAG: cyclic nucleotide-binding domain-containing protein [Coleofasciculus sp. D1-CHI-01]|uniref:cyclic nucleotide-binding domain-containing protein n=1 Tax=Coleofasciculus sp. D1-CHI-01 TaxID=3068482 RepID=UPI0032F115AE